MPLLILILILYCCFGRVSLFWLCVSPLLFLRLSTKIENIMFWNIIEKLWEHPTTTGTPFSMKPFQNNCNWSTKTTSTKLVRRLETSIPVVRLNKVFQILSKTPSTKAQKRVPLTKKKVWLKEPCSPKLPSFREVYIFWAKSTNKTPKRGTDRALSLPRAAACPGTRVIHRDVLGIGQLGGGCDVLSLRQFFLSLLWVGYGSG